MFLFCRALVSAVSYCLCVLSTYLPCFLCVALCSFLSQINLILHTLHVLCLLLLPPPSPLPLPLLPLLPSTVLLLLLLLCVFVVQYNSYWLLNNVICTGIALGTAVDCIAIFHLRRHRNAGNIRNTYSLPVWSSPLPILLTGNMTMR